MRVVLTGGGTGGHIYPALAIGREVMEQEPQSSLLYMGTNRGMESRIVPEQGIAFEAITITGFRRSLSWENVRTVVRFLKGVRRAKALLKKFKPDIVVGTGGYVCGPVVYAASRLGIPTLIHEQNVIPGLTNKFLSRYVNAVAVSFEESVDHFKRCPSVVYSGNPRASEVVLAKKEQGFASLGLPSQTPFVLIVGGSSGAKAINNAFLEMLPKLVMLPDIHYVFVTGDRFYEEAAEKMKQLRAGTVNEDQVHILPYINNMPEVLSAASLVISRAGASLLAEIAALGNPSILIPSPNVTNNHQEANARSLADAGAAVMIVERQLTGELLYNHIAEIMGNQSLRMAMAAASLKLGMPRAATTIYEQMKQLTKKR